MTEAKTEAKTKTKPTRRSKEPKRAITAQQRRRLRVPRVGLHEQAAARLRTMIVRGELAPGGNIQKLILARELSRDPKVLIAAQPTRGLDIGATHDVHKLLLEQRNHGIATLLISEDLDEILALSDRIAVLYEGQIMGVLEKNEATAEKLGLLMAGVRLETASSASISKVS